MLRVYLDNCMFNRPFDDQTALRIFLETQAKLHIQQQIKENQLTLIWSYMLDFENDLNPFDEKRFAIGQWKYIAKEDIPADDVILELAKEIMPLGIREKDALHIACAIFAKADYFLSTDDKLLKKMANHAKIITLDPIQFLKVLTDEN